MCICKKRGSSLHLSYLRDLWTEGKRKRAILRNNLSLLINDTGSGLSLGLSLGSIPGTPGGHRSDQKTRSFPRGNWWPHPTIPHLCHVTPRHGSRTMSDAILLRLLPILISAMSHYKLLHSQNGNRLRWRWREGEMDGWMDGGKGGGSGVSVHRQPIP